MVYVYEAYKDGTRERVGTYKVDEPFKVPGEPISPICMDEKGLPGTVTKICLQLGKSGEIIRRIWVKQDSYTAI